MKVHVGPHKGQEKPSIAAGKQKTLGILGGMGPEATAYFFELIIRLTAADEDQEHIPVIIRSDPRVPDRSKAILEGGPSPLPSLIEGAMTLRAAGADLAVMPCVSAHYFLPELAARVKIPFISLLEESREFLRKEHPGVRKVGLVATTGTVRSGVVRDAFARAGVEVLIPSEADQARIMEAIYGPKGIKAGFTTGSPRRTVLGVARRLVREGAQAVMAGCTEIPVVLTAEDFLRVGGLDVPFVEPMLVGARACVLRAGFRLRFPAR
jgi:aspartate racemase